MHMVAVHHYGVVAVSCYSNTTKHTLCLHVCPVHVLLPQVSEDDYQKPVVLLLLVSAPPPRPEVLAQIVLPTDKPIAGVNMHIDADKELCFPSNSFLGQGAFGQVCSWSDYLQSRTWLPPCTA